MLVDQICFFVIITIFFALNLFNKLSKCFKKARIKNSNESKSALKNEPTTKSNETLKTLKFILNSYASFNSIVICIGFISETYLYGGRLLMNLVSVSIGYLVAFFILHPVVYRLKSSRTPFEYLQHRYRDNRLIRVIAALCGILFYLLFMSLHLWGCSIVLSTILPQIPYLFISTIVIGAYGTIGSIFKGFNQSITINIIQIVLLLSGLISALVITFNSNKNNKTAGDLWEIAGLYNRRNFIEQSGDLRTRYTVWNQVFSLPIPWCTIHILMQPNFTKYRAIKGNAKSRFILISHLPVMFLINTLFVFCGIAAFVFYYDNDPISSKRVENKNQIAILWLIESLDLYLPSLAGFSLAALFANGIQVYSVGIWACSNSFLNDVLGELVKQKTKIIKAICCCLFGALSIVLSFLFKYAKNSILSLFFLFSNSLNSPILGLFLLSMFNPKANHVGALLAFIINLAINLWLALSSVAFSNLKNQEFTPLVFNSVGNQSALVTNTTIANDEYYPKDQILFYLYSISSIWYCLFSLLFNLILGSLFSFIYSLVKTKSFDADSSFKDERRKYLFKIEYLFSNK